MSRSSFYVDIADCRTVSELRQKILLKNQNTIMGVPDEHQLKIWKHYMSTKDLEIQLANLQLHDDNALDGAVLLSDEFSDACLGQIHVIAEVSDADSWGDFPLKRSQFTPAAEVDKAIDQFLSKCRPRIQELVNDISSFLPSWKPESSADEAFKRHMSELCIPAIGNRPSLLLHNLGGNKTKLEKERFSRIPGVFCRHEHRILLNTSGSGKTRLLLDGLCYHWGFYFAADTKEVGSQDFRTIIDEFKMNETKLRTPEATAGRGLSQLLLSRFLLLELLVEEVGQNGRQVSSLQNRRLWVLLQAQPRRIFGADLFLELAQLLRPAAQSDLEARIRNKCQALSSRLNPSNQQSFYCVLDEAQITADPRL